MRLIVFALAFFSLLPLIFIRGPFVGILMWFWISLMAPQGEVYGFLADIPYALIVAVATLLMLFLSASEPKLPPLNRTSVLFFLLMVWVSATSLLGTGPWDIAHQHWLLAEKMLLMTLVALALTNSRERLDGLIAVCALSVTIYGFKGGVFTLLHGGAFRVSGPDDSMLTDNDGLGVALTTMLPMLFYLARRYAHFHVKWPVWGMIGLTVIGDLFTYSRGALVALAAMAVVGWCRSRRKVVSAILVLFAAAAVWNFAPAQWLDQMRTIRNYQQDQSAEERLYLWRLGWAIALRHPIFGAGFDWSFDTGRVNSELHDSGFHWDSIMPSDAAERVGQLPPLIEPRAMHSIWFEVLSAQGFPGLALFAAILLGFLFDARWLTKQARGRPELDWAADLGRMLLASLVGFAVAGTYATFAFYDGFYALVMIAAAARRVVAGGLVAASAADAPEAAPAVAGLRSRTA